jgi:hypothetical protein
MAQVHVRYEGHSYDMELVDLDLGDLSTDTDVRRAVAEALEAPVGKLAAFTIDRNQETGDVTMRPQAVFGG